MTLKIGSTHFLTHIDLEIIISEINHNLSTHVLLRLKHTTPSGIGENYAGNTYIPLIPFSLRIGFKPIIIQIFNKFTKNIHTFNFHNIHSFYIFERNI